MTDDTHVLALTRSAFEGLCLFRRLHALDRTAISRPQVRRTAMR